MNSKSDKDFPETAPSNPVGIWIEPTTRCNTRCAHCTHYYRQFGCDMDPGVYRKVRALMLDRVTSVELLGCGEPLLAGNFWELFEDCDQRGLDMVTSTNGLLLQKDEILKRLVRSRITLTLSIDGARKETFEFVRPFIKWETMLDILKRIREAAGEAGDERRFRFRVNFVAMKQNIEDLPDLVNLVAKHGAQMIVVLPLGGEEIYSVMKDQGLYEEPRLISRIYRKTLKTALRHKISISLPPAFRRMMVKGAIGGDGILDKIGSIGRLADIALLFLRRDGPGYFLQKLVQFIKPRDHGGLNYCRMPWNNTYFAVDGKIFPCCVIGQEMGDLATQEWDEIWNGQAYRNLRRTIHSWNPTEVCRMCVLPDGINGGDARRYEKKFRRYRVEEIPLDHTSVEFGEGFYELEKTDGKPSHRWMSKRGELILSMPRGARFLRLLIIRREPEGRLNPGRCRINGGPPEPFDNTCGELNFPLSLVRDSKLHVVLEMENAFQIGRDPRDLALAIRGIRFLS